MLATGYWLLATPSLLISGPAGSGKSRAALDRFLADPASTLLTPTATMAEHVRNELARASLPVRPHRILTLAKFIEPFTEFQDAPESLIHLLIAQSDLSSFGEVAEFHGFHRALASQIQEASALPDNVARIARDIDDQLALRGRALREKRLRTAKPIAPGPIIVDGFFTLTPAELDVIENLAAQTSVTVTLPDWPGSVDARARLLNSGFVEQRFDRCLRQPSRTVFAAPTLDQEVEEIALRILDHSARGREFRDIGILLRVRDPYASALETTFARFGIPARFHFTDPLSAHPAIQYITGLIRALLNGWDHADLLPLLRMPISGIGATPEGDLLDFAIRENLPNTSLQALEELRPGGVANHGGSRLSRQLAEITTLDPWTRDRLAPTDWATRLKTLRKLIPTPQITDQVDHVQIQIWRSIAAALIAFDSALDTTAIALNNRTLSLAAFWPQAEAAFSIEKLRVPDRRRHVVNVLDVFEARQWELKIAFVCGLTYHREDQYEERFLFDLATTRATEETVLSYARFNDKGDAQLRSFFLEEEGKQVGQGRALPKPVTQVHALPNQAPPPDLRIQHSKLAPTSIESFLQCPFQFFARKTLKLRPRPAKPRDRLDVLLQGNILHQALAEGSLARVFEAECRRHNIPRTYRTEAVRLELLRHFEAFQSDKQWPLNWSTETEKEFVMSLTPELSIRGRIDRLEIGPGNQAIVIDYKYSAAAKIRERMESDPVQGGLYLSAAGRCFHLQPVGMFYCGLRQSVTWEGWHAIPGFALGEPAALLELIAAAEQQAIDVFESIISGNMEVRPADRAKCRYCDFNAICRTESIPSAAAATKSGKNGD
jgi:hypothetical protein